jgi:hypothetical protein
MSEVCVVVWFMLRVSAPPLRLVHALSRTFHVQPAQAI